MKVLISPNAFKGTLTATEVGEIINKFIKESSPGIQTKMIPIADGGDGTCELLTKVLGLKQISTWTLDPFGRPILGTFGLDTTSKKAFIDVSTASGIGLIGSETKNPFVASTFGTGLLIQKAIEEGAEEIILGLGGSATIDLGIGILAALGLSFLDEKGRSLTPFSPEYLGRISHIQRSPNFPKINFICLCDVKNTFLGSKGAIPVFGSQKGLEEQEFKSYEATCETVIKKMFSKMKKSFEDQVGFGAAGGIALGLSAFFPLEIKFGSTYFFEKIKLGEAVKWADLIITGEGKYDSQSNEGKACFELLQLAKNQQKKSVLISSGNEAFNEGFNEILILPELDFSDPDYKTKARENLLGLIKSQLKVILEEGV
ncbi:MAG: glycerate kinase [Algoriphagus sp.]|nr:glycerate kinase [Algoriphagus sp.]